MKVGMIRHRCPECGEIIFRHAYEVDTVHKCVKADHITRKTTKTEFDKIPGKINIKFDKDYFVNLGLNPYPKLRRKGERRKSCFKTTEVNTYIKFDDLEEV